MKISPCIEMCNIPPKWCNISPRIRSQRGFTLVISLLLIIMITVLAVGLLSLSSVSLRSSSQSAAIQTARYNARMALNLAIGQLQKAAGPDQRITAPANVRAATAHAALTGAWESRKLSPQGDADLDTIKETLQPDGDVQANGEFIGWLTSTSETTAPSASGPPATGANAVTLLSVPSADGNAQDLTMDTISVRDNKGLGAVAWATIDEGIKARMDLPVRSTSSNDYEEFAILRAPARNAPEVLTGLTEFQFANGDTKANKLASFHSGELIASDRDTYRSYWNDITPWSASLLTNTADGGLKADLTRAFEQASLPSAFNGKYVYSNDQQALTVADPPFTLLKTYYDQYKTWSSDFLKPQIPSDFLPVNGSVPNLGPIDGDLKTPLVTRVSVAFSLVSRPAHGYWNSVKPANRPNMVYMIYTPIVTLYNPYNHSIQVSKIEVSFRDLPLGFKFYRGTSGSEQIAADAIVMNDLFINGNKENLLNLTLVNSPTGNATSSNFNFILAPGESRTYGKSLRPTDNWGVATNYVYESSSKTLEGNMRPGIDLAYGYIVDWLANGVVYAGGAGTNVATQIQDMIDVEIVPKIPSGVTNFSVSVKSNGKEAAFYRYEYGSLERLTKAMTSGLNLSYPQRMVGGAVALNNIWFNGSDTSAATLWQDRVMPFAMFTFADRTALDSQIPSKVGKHSSFTHPVLDMDITKAEPEQVPMEISFVPLDSAGNPVYGSAEFNFDPSDSRLSKTYQISGNRPNTGILNCPSIFLPKAPLLNVGGFRHANLSNSGYLPISQRTVGESFAQPLIPANQAVTATSSFGYALTDHAWLANRTLWEGFYMSAVYDNAESSQFFVNRQPLALNPRYMPYVPSGMKAEDISSLVTSDSGWESMAAYQMLKGGFNVNSTSKNAWKALLSSLGNPDVPTISVSGTSFQLTSASTNDTPFPRSLLGISESFDQNSSADNQLRWTGFRELNDQQIDSLAEQIVLQVKERGPFLSLAEFLNRKLTNASDEHSQGGAMEIAIQKSTVNQKAKDAAVLTISESDVSAFGYENVNAAVGDPEEGSNAYLSQGDLMEAIGAVLVVRSDTFVIRAYGDARDANGSIVAKAVCEAVVQRLPEYIDSTDDPDLVQSALGDATRTQDSLTAVNQRFGRRFSLINFRWISSNEL